MMLQLAYHENHHAPVNAAVVPGGDSYAWLTEISYWDVDLRAIRCYILPESIGSNKAGGLFVIFQHETIAAKLSLRAPYTQVAPGFYIPVHATLTPDVATAELIKFMLWDIQVFHPSAGLTGFEAKDELNLNDLTTIPVESGRDWLPAFPKARAYPGLNSVRLEPEETPFDPNALVEQLPLSEIPDSDGRQHTPIKQLLRVIGTIGLWILLILAAIGKIIFAILRAFFGKRLGRPVPARKKGLLKRLEDWVNTRLKDIEKQRDSELNRLVKLFDKNTDDALQYAIPLDSPYLNRGIAPQSGKLTRRSLSLNFRSFGGSGSVDRWDLGEYRMALRQQYIKALNAAIEKGDYKKAAYIYAHLLGDLFMAAQMLQTGKHYREAAAIYKDHLNNRSKAAECLEKGGLLHEAIPIYADLGNYEKVGDLYVQLGQQQLAAKYYNDTVKRSLDSKDYLNAARLKTEKMHEYDAGKAILLDGWKDDNQPEQCLSKYFEELPAEELAGKVKDVYENQVGARRKTAFLKVLAGLFPGNSTHFQQTAVDISYEVVHQQAKRGDFSGLNLLTKFLPGDRLLAQDASRYILQNHRKVPLATASSYLALRSDTQWITIINYHDQLLGVGVKNQELHLFRANWEGKITYEFLFLVTGLNPFIRLVADAQLSSQVILTGNAVPLGARKKMSAFSYFEKEFDFLQLNWQLPNTLGYGIQPQVNDGVFILHVDDDQICIDLFSYEGSLLKKTCLINGGEKISAYDMPLLPYSEMYWRKDHFYFIARDRLIRLDEKGQLTILPFETEVSAFSISGPHTALKIAAITDAGCLIIIPTLKEMKVNTPAFATEMKARFVQLLSDSRLVLANAELALVYDISNAVPKLICEIQPENPILSILKVPKRHHFALHEADSRISIHELKEDAF